MSIPMHRVSLTVIASAISLASGPSPAGAIGPATPLPTTPLAATPLGDWSTANGGGVIRIAPCGNALCGWIVGIDRAPGEPMPTDVYGRPQCGLAIITGETPGEDDTWLGRITDPRDGDQYRAELWVDSEGRLHLRGYIGTPLFGRTEVWHRFAGHLTGECHIA